MIRISKKTNGVVIASFSEEVSLTQILSFSVDFQEQEIYLSQKIFIFDFSDCFNFEQLDTQSLLEIFYIMAKTREFPAHFAIVSQSLKFTPACEIFFENMGSYTSGLLQVFVEPKEAFDWFLTLEDASLQHISENGTRGSGVIAPAFGGSTLPSQVFSLHSLEKS